MLPVIISGLFNMGSGWLQNRREKTQAVHKKEMEVIANGHGEEIARQNGMAKSWKDEYWSIVLSIPILMAFFGESERMMEAFVALETTPEWFQWYLGVAIIVSFGGKVSDVIRGKR